MAAFTEDKLASRTDPFIQFEAWYQEAAQILPKPSAMCLSTCGKDGKPSSRMIQLGKRDENGLKFFTDSRSQKAKAMRENPYVSVVFYWSHPSLERQVRVTGKVEDLPAEEAVAFVKTIPRENQLVLLTHHQDEVVSSRAELDRKYKAVQEKYASTKREDLPIPEHWKGYRIVPDKFEFMQSADNWLGDRLIFSLEDKKWVLMREEP